MKLLTKVILSLVLGLSSLTTFAQTKLTGTVVDETDKSKLSNATVMLLQAKDSILVNFTRANQDGKFSLNNPDTSDYLLIVSYPKFGDYFQEIAKGSGDKNLGELALQSSANLIEEILITGKIPVVIKGDTVEYDASSFVTEKNAKVEDLLKVLPGISVDASGKITAQGKTVEKVLVDGEEFFGDDPTLVTRNIRSDMVDKVQVFEKKSEDAERTGVDDGQRIQTINVKLKEDAKNGMFGKLEGGGGMDDNSGYYLGKVALNKFNGSRKISAFGITSNDGTTDLGWQEAEKFGIANDNVTMLDDGGIMISGGGSFLSNTNRGQPRAITAGVSFMDAWKEKKHKLNLNYKYGQAENEINTNTISQTPLADGISNSEFDNSDVSKSTGHRFNTKYDFAIDSLTTLTLRVAASKMNGENDTYRKGNSFKNGELITEDERSQKINTSNDNFNYDANFTRKFAKEGRSINLKFTGNNGKTQGDMLLNSKLNNVVAGTENVIDQFKDNSNNSSSIMAAATYTEPISKKVNMSVGYEYTNSKAHSINSAFNKDAAGNYTEFDSEFSNDFNFNTVRNAANLSVNYKAEKLEFNLTNNIRHDDMFQRNNLADNSMSRDYLTYNPRARLRYNISKAKSLNLSYNRSNQLPSLFQIQPLKQNEDQMNQYFGNENLKPSVSNNYNLNYYWYDMMKGKGLYSGLGFTQTLGAIQTDVIVYENLKRELYYVNTDKAMTNGYLYGGYNFNLIKKHQIKMNVGLNGSLNNYYNMIKDLSDPANPREFEENKNVSYNFSGDIGFQKSTTKGFDFYVSFSPGYRVLNTTLNPELNSEGFTFDTYGRFTYFLPKKFQITGDLNYEYEAPTKALPSSFSRLKFSPGIQKKFLKNESLIANFYVNDVFNQNVGFSRSQSGQGITQQRYNNIARYYMLKLTWEFTSMKGAE
ncbi:TonB-dependent receptor domain-containing protein [Sphingobacterium endophyticum]|uniref:TonB-dependent receptor domain-containing protein n=1 Tax=Sphingobacterium endophyticum TaxID=2546448 RepID=UPI0012E16C1F|nr:TonB-dependent receptor [Sphingobacterium endophyticum]